MLLCEWDWWTLICKKVVVFSKFVFRRSLRWSVASRQWRALAVAIEFSREETSVGCPLIQRMPFNQSNTNQKVSSIWKWVSSMLSESSMNTILIFLLTLPLFSLTSTPQDSPTPCTKHALLREMESISSTRSTTRWKFLKNHESNTTDHHRTAEHRQQWMSWQWTNSSVERPAPSRLKSVTLETAPIAQYNHSSNTLSLIATTNTRRVFGENCRSVRFSSPANSTRIVSVSATRSWQSTAVTGRTSMIFELNRWPRSSSMHYTRFLCELCSCPWMKSGTRLLCTYRVTLLAIHLYGSWIDTPRDMSAIDGPVK